MGLSNVRERIAALGGTIAIWSLPGKGTTLHLCIPLVQPHAHEQERVNQELATAVHKTRRILRIGIWAAELAAILMLLYTPAFIALWAALICIIAALASWLLAQQYRLQVSLEFGREHTQSIALLSESYGLLSGTLLLGMLYPNYFKLFYYPFDFAFIPMKFIANNVWLVSGFFGVFITAIVVTYVLYARNIDRYYKTLSGKSLREQLRQQFQQLVIDWLAWAIVVGLTVFLLNFLPTISTEPTVQGTGLILLCAWFIIILLKSIRTARWHNVLRVSTERVTQEQKGGSV